jgi:hypothetical protein
MNPLRKACILAVSGLFFASQTHAQQITLNQSTTETSGPLHQLLACPDGDYLDLIFHFADDKEPVTATRFDPHTLTARYTSQIPELVHLQDQTVMYAGDRLFLFATHGQGDVSRYEINDKNGTLVGPATILFNLEQKENDVNFSSGSSADKRSHYLVTEKYYYKEKNTRLQGVILDQQMNKTAAFSYTFDGPRDQATPFHVVQADDGGLFILLGFMVKTEKDDYRPWAYTLLQVDTKGKVSATPLTGLPAGVLRNFTLVPRKNQLFITAFQLKGKKDKAFSGFVSGSYDLVQKKYSDIKQVELKSLMTQSPDITDYIEKKWLTWDVVIIKTFTLSDGSGIQVLERNALYRSLSGTGNVGQIMPFGNTFSTPTGPVGASASAGTINYPQRGDLYILKVDRDNRPQWFNVIPRWQEEIDRVITIGTACVAGDHDKIHLFYYDDKKDTEPAITKRFLIYGKEYKSNKLACLTIAPDGKMNKQLLDIPEPQFRWNVESAMTSVPNKFVLMTIKPHFSLSFEKFYNKSEYRLSSAEIK